MSESIQGILRRFYSEIIGSGVSLFFILVVWVIDNHISGLDTFLRFSLFERATALLIISFVVGKTAEMLGYLVCSIARWLAFQKDKLQYLKSYFQALNEQLIHGRKHISTERNSLTKPEILTFINSNEEISVHFSKIHGLLVFWRTANGLSIFAFFIFINEKWAWTLPLIFLGTLLISLYGTLIEGEFWSDCAKETSRGKASS